MSEVDSNLISRIQSSTKARLIGWQFAADGRWDVAERIVLARSAQATPSRIEHWLAMQTSENVAFEALFESENNETLFFGVRIAHLTTQERAEVMKRVTATGRRGDGVDATVRNIRSVLGGRRLAEALPDYLELGVLDLWNRVKSVVVWQAGATPGSESELMMPEDLADRVQNPDVGFAPLHEPQTRALMLEAVWKRNPDIGGSYQYWIGLPVSDNDSITGKYCLSESRYRSAISTFIARRPA